MAVWQFVFWIIPQNRKNVDLQVEESLSWKSEKIGIDICDYLSGIFKEEKSWSEQIRQFGKEEKTCVRLRFVKDKIAEINCRLDLRILSKDELNKILSFISEIKGKIFYKDEIYPINLETITKLIQKSDAAKFCLNPQQYFKNL